jgi:hypothetical protein
MDLSSRLGDVAWAELEHAYDGAADIPGLLLDISDSERPDHAVGMLRDRLLYQGYVVYSATVDTVPILVDMVAEVRRPARPAIVRLIADLAREAATVGSEHETKIRWSQMWHGKLPAMVNLLGDDDVEVRRVASSVLASAEFGQDIFITRLLGVCEKERDEPARLGQLVAIADLLPAASVASRHEVIGQVGAIVAGGSAQMRMAGAFVSCRIEPVDVHVFLDALNAPDVEKWRQTWCVVSQRQSILRFVDDRLQDDRDLRRDLGLTLLTAPDVGTRTAAFGVLMRVASTWRSPMLDVARAGYRALDDPDESVRRRALFALAVSRSGQPEHADGLAALAGVNGYPGLAAVWGLARMGDSRCVPHLMTALRSDDLGYPCQQVYAGTMSHPVLPSIDEILREAATWSGQLLPAVVRRLLITPPGLERRALLQTLTEWGLSAKAAMPALIDGLSAQEPSREIVALAAVGADKQDLPIGILNAAFQRASTVTGEDRISVIRAYTRITGDFGPAFAELPDLRSKKPLTPAALHLVGALGAAGAGYAGRIEALMPKLGTWATLGAAKSYWEITGETGPAGTALAGLLADLETGRQAVMADLLALRLIEQMGFGDPALTSVLQLLAAAETRVTGPASEWQDIDLDDSLADVSARILDATAGRRRGE